MSRAPSDDRPIQPCRGAPFGEPLEPRLFLSAAREAVGLAVLNPMAAEAGGLTASIVVSRGTPSLAPLTVNLAVRGTATEGADFDAIPRSVTIPALATWALVPVVPRADAEADPNETVVVSVAAGDGYRAPRDVATVGVLLTDASSPGTSPPTSPPVSPPPPPPPPPPPTTDPGTGGTDGGGTGTTVDPVPATGSHRFLYVFDAPKDRQGFETLKPQIEVFDIAAGHQWVRNIPIPAKIYDIRGVAVNAATGRIFISYFLTPKIGYQPGGLLAMDANTSKLLWKRDYKQTDVPAPDRFDVTPDGRKIYMPSGEFGTSDFWVVIDAANGDPIGRVHHTSTAHNTIVSADGTRAFLEGQEKQAEPAEVVHTIGVVDTRTDQVIQRVGPFKDVLRPFTINGTGSLVFASMNNFFGFQVGDVATGKVIFTAPVPGVAQPTTKSLVTATHGIALTPDEKEVYLVDTKRTGLHYWDVSGVKVGVAPVYEGFIPVRKLGKNLAGQTDPAAGNDTNGAPSWIAVSWDGKYVYPEGGEIIDRATHKIVGQLRAKQTNSAGALVDAPYTHSRFIIEVDVEDGRVARATNQFGVGRVT